MFVTIALLSNYEPPFDDDGADNDDNNDNDNDDERTPDPFQGTMYQGHVIKKRAQHKQPKRLQI